MVASESTKSQRGTVAIVIGTRPEIIKLAPVVHACIREKVPYILIHTGQHYSPQMDAVILRDLQLPSPDYNLKIGSGSHAEETAKALVGLEKLFVRINPQIVLVQGDTNSTLAAALAASKLHIKIGHVEAGLRSFDREMPEETNRILADHVSDLLFAPTEVSANNLIAEGLPRTNIFVIGNTVVDTLNLGLDLIAKKSDSLEWPNPSGDGDFFLLTLHREENVDSEYRLRRILRAVETASKKYNMRVVFPAHPRTIKRVRQFGISLSKNVILGRPEGYLQFLELERRARMILTDSGGIQEEACVLKIPCVTLRRTTERPETVKVGANFLSGVEPDEITHGVQVMMNTRKDWANPFGDGHASTRILETVTESEGNSFK